MDQMKTRALRYARVLDFYDAPLVIEAQDENDRRYLCDSLATREDGEWFIIVPITDEQAAALNRGEICMRSAMELAGRKEWYLSVPQWDFTKSFEIERQEGPIADSPELCGEGYMLTGAWDDSSDF